MTIFNVPIKSQYLKKKNKINVILFAIQSTFIICCQWICSSRGKKSLHFSVFSNSVILHKHLGPVI